MTYLSMGSAPQQSQAVEQAVAEVRAQAQAEVERAMRQAQQEVQRARREAEAAQREAEQAVRAAQREAEQMAREARTSQPPPWVQEFPGAPRVPEEAVVIAIAFFVMCAIIAIGMPIARAFARRMDKRSTATPPVDNDTRMRIERIEQAVDAIALEIERISEGQRFTSKVLSDMRSLREPVPADALAVPTSRANDHR